MSRAARRSIIATATVLLVALLGAAYACPPPMPVQPATQPAGDARAEVEVLHGGIWWDAVVLDERRDAIKVHYLGWDASWDAWVAPSHVRAADARRVRQAQRGDRVEINWRGGWWAGRVLAADRHGRYRITYDGYSADWDEWVTPARLRRAADRDV